VPIEVTLAGTAQPLRITVDVLPPNCATRSSAAPYGTPTPIPPTRVRTPLRRVVTDMDDGQTIALTIGDRVELRMGSGYRWDIRLDNEEPLALVAESNTYSGTFEARQVGRVLLTATGIPECRWRQPSCADPVRTYQFWIEIAPIGPTTR
jgi:hypothetical protein